MKKLTLFFLFCKLLSGQSLTVSLTQNIAVDETNAAIEPFSMSGYDPSETYKVSLAVSTTLAVNFSVPTNTGLILETGYTSWANITSVNFTGPPSNIQNGLNSILFNTTTDVDGEIIFNVVVTEQIANTFYNPDNGHIYKFVSGGISYSAARDAALLSTYEGELGYLVNITSAEEQTFVSNNTTAEDIWTGLTDEGSEGTWYWRDGPEAGTIIGSGKTSSFITVAGQYSNWCNNEPNDYSVGEDYMVTNWNGGSCWNDYGPPYLSGAGSTEGYLIEYGTATSTFSSTENKKITLTQVKVDPNLTFNDVTKSFGDANFNLTATSSSTGAFTFTISDTSIATITGSTVSIVTAGITVVTVSQAADSKYYAAIATMTLTINKINPTIAFNDVVKDFGDTDFSLLVSSNSSGTFSFGVSDTNIATVNNGVITITGGGSTTITVNQAEDTNYFAGIATMTLTVNRASGAITFNDLTKTYGDPVFMFNATSLSTGAMTFSVSNTSIATMVGSSTRIIGAGSTIVEVNQAADENYNAATASMTLTVLKADPIIVFEDLIKNIDEANFSFTATSSSTGAFSFLISDTTIASLSGVVVSLLNLGGTVVTVNQAADSNYNSASATMTLQVVADPIILFDDVTKTFGDPNFELTAISTSPAPFTFTISDTLIAELNSSTVTIKKAGTTIVFVKQEAFGNYNALTSSMTLTILKANPNIVLQDIIKTYGDSDFEINPSSNSSGDFSFSVDNTSIASIENNTVSIAGVGTTYIRVNQTSETNYNSGNTSALLTVVKANPTIVFEDIIKDLGDSQFEIEYISNSSGDVSFSLENTSIGALSSTSLLPLQLGQTTLTLNQSETYNYTSGLATATFTVFEKIDSDGDGITNTYDLDDDNDGIFDTDELDNDLDQDGLINSIDLDSDGDGCLDVVEAGFLDNDNDGIVGTSPVVVDTQGLVQNINAYITPADRNQNLTYDFLDYDTDFNFQNYSLPNQIQFNVNESFTLDIGIDDPIELEYQWQISRDGGITFENLNEEKSTLTIIPELEEDGNLYRIIITQRGFACAEPYVSNSSKIIFRELLIPTGFSPNGDGTNDYWQIVGIDNYPNNTITIFNRLGIKVFSSTNYKNDWNGFFNGKVVPDGTYFYELNLGGNNIKKGYLYVKAN